LRQQGIQFCKEILYVRPIIGTAHSPITQPARSDATKETPASFAPGWFIAIARLCAEADFFFADFIRGSILIAVA
jgi:hypothetical protein